jgi:phosphatidate cytidylyltransferase
VNLSKRVITAIIFLSITLISILIGGAWLAGFLMLLVYAGNKELVSIFRAKDLNPNVMLILTIDYILIILASLKQLDYMGLIITIGSISAFLVVLARGIKAKIADVGATILAIIYGGWLPVHLIMLRNLNAEGIQLFGLTISNGLSYLIFIFFVISISDIAGYYVGKNFGKTPLWAEISPKKTLEGSIGSTVGGIIIAVLTGNLIGLDLIHSIIAGTLLTLAAQFGDLAESMLKRDAGVKDSGNLIPGHGGVLDRADSYIFTGALAYYYFNIFVIENHSLFNLFS